MTTLRDKITRWAIASGTGKGRTLLWNQYEYRAAPYLCATRKAAQAECDWQNRNWKDVGRTYRPVEVSIVITEIKTAKKGKK